MQSQEKLLAAISAKIETLHALQILAIATIISLLQQTVFALLEKCTI